MMTPRVVSAVVVASVAATAALAQIYSFSTVVELRLSLPPGGVVPYLANVAVDGSGNVYAVQTDRHAVFKLTPPRDLTVLAGTPLAPGSVDGTAAEARFAARPLLNLGIAADAAGNVFVADEGNRTIRKVTPAGEVSTLAGKAGAVGNDDGRGSEARFLGPISLCVHVDGDLYVVDGRFPQSIRRITSEGVVSTLLKVPASNGIGGLSSIAVDRDRNVFVTCYDDVVRKISSTGEVTIFAGQPGSSGDRDGKGGAARFHFSHSWFDAVPVGVTIDSFDNLFTVDPGGGRIRRITPQGDVTTVSPVAPLYWASGIAIDRAMTLYVTDSFLDSKILKGTTSSTLNVIATPQSRTIAPGTTAVFSLDATGTGLTYQWTHYGTQLVGAAQANLLISPASASDSGVYACRVTDASGATASFSATLNVSAATPGRFANLSAQSVVASGRQAFSIGFTVSGISVERPLPVLVRVAGPSLSRFLPTGFLDDPVLALRSPTQLLMTNDDWSGDPQIAAWSERVGAFPYNSAGSRDAAVATALPPGNYTVEPVAKGASAGVALCEVFDATTLAGAETSPRVTNFSALGQLDVNRDALTVGFVLSGSGARTVLLRAVGPSLASLGVAEGAANPMLQLYERSTLARQNRDWGGDQQLIDVMRRIGAFPLSSRGSRDAVLLVTLTPGDYTIVVRDENGAPGLVLVEVYEVP